MELLWFVWLVILSFAVAGHSSAITRIGASLGTVRAWIDAVVAQSQGKAVTPEVAPVAAVAATSPSQPAPVAASQAAPEKFSAAQGEEHGGRWLAIVGVLAIVGAAGFAVQYAIERGWLTEGLRMVLGVILGLGLSFLGHKLRARFGWFGDAVLGLGLGLLYLTVYSGYVFFDFYGYAAALVATVMVSALAALLALSAKVEAPAALGAAGAFMTAIILPMTASAGAVAFAFAAAAVALAAAAGTNWRATQAVALMGSATVFAEFLAMGYDSESHFAFVVTFALLFVALFFFAGSGSAIVQRRVASQYEVGLSAIATLIFAPIAIALAADRSLDADGMLPLLLALAFGIAAAWGQVASPKSELGNGVSAGLSAAFLAAAISLQLDGAWVSVLWAAEAVALAALAYQTRAAGFAALSGALGFMALAATADVSLAADAVPVWNVRFACFLAVLVAGWTLASVARVVSRMPGKDDWRTGFAFVAVLSHVVALGVLAGEVDLSYQEKINATNAEYRSARGIEPAGVPGYGFAVKDTAREISSREQLQKLESSRATAIAIVWGLYGAIILAVGFAVSSAPSRYAGVGTLLLAAGDVFLIVWDLGTGYRIVASLTVGVLALGGAYLFARYKHRLVGKA